MTLSNTPAIQTALSASREISSSEFGGLPLPPGYFQIFQVSSASVSFLSSLTIAVSVAFFGNIGLSTPYRRIIFGLSVSDILQSLALLTGPSSVPPSKFSEKAINEAASCEANGLILDVGATAVMMYTFFLCLYYLCKLKYRMSDQSFNHRIETKLHLFIWAFSLATNIAAVALNTVHPISVSRSFCTVASTPTGCGMSPDIVGKCEKTNMAEVNTFIYMGFIALPAVCFVGIIVTMALLYRHAFLWNQIIERELHVPTPLRNAKAREGEEDEDEDHDVNSAQEDNESQSPQDRVQHLSRLYRRETMIQATSYVGAFFVTYMPLIVITLLSYFSLYPPAVSAIFLFFFPLGGFLNILVYTRPKVASLRRSHPECSRLRGFWLVLRAGGEIPEDIDSPPSCCECCRVPEWLRSEYYYERTTTTNVGGGDGDGGGGGEGDGRAKSTSIGSILARLGF